jgi:hypothetical protein
MSVGKSTVRRRLAELACSSIQTLASRACAVMEHTCIHACIHACTYIHTHAYEQLIVSIDAYLPDFDTCKANLYGMLIDGGRVPGTKILFSVEHVCYVYELGIDVRLVHVCMYVFVCICDDHVPQVISDGDLGL